MYSVKATNSEGDCTTVAKLYVLGQYNSQTGSSSGVVRSRRAHQTTHHQTIRQISSPSPTVVSVSSSPTLIRRQSAPSPSFVISRQSSTVSNQMVPVSSYSTTERQLTTTRHIQGIQGGVTQTPEDIVVNVEISF